MRGSCGKTIGVASVVAWLLCFSVSADAHVVEGSERSARRVLRRTALQVLQKRVVGLLPLWARWRARMSAGTLTGPASASAKDRPQAPELQPPTLSHRGAPGQQTERERIGLHCERLLVGCPTLAALSGRAYKLVRAAPPEALNALQCYVASTMPEVATGGGHADPRRASVLRVLNRELTRRRLLEIDPPPIDNWRELLRQADGFAELGRFGVFVCGDKPVVDYVTDSGDVKHRWNLVGPALDDAGVMQRAAQFATIRLGPPFPEYIESIQRDIEIGRLGQAAERH